MSLLNVSAVRAEALRRGKHKGFTRVSPKYLKALERKVAKLIEWSVFRHRSAGKTITDFNP